MKKMVTAVLAVLIGLAFLTASFGQTPTEKATTTVPEKPAKPMGKTKTMTYSGGVVTVDSAANTAVVKGKTGEMTFDLSETKWKGYKSAKELKPGDKVSVRYVERDGKMMATWVGEASWTKRMRKKAKEEKEEMKEK